MKYDDRFKYLVGGYFGVKAMDKYERKLYVLKDIENYIISYIRDINDKSIDYRSIAEEIEKNATLKEKLQDSLIVLNEMKGPIDLVLMIKLKVKELKYSHK